MTNTARTGGSRSQSAILAAVALSHAAESLPATRTVALSAEQAFEAGQGAFGMQKHSGGGVELYDRRLVEDDGPGVGIHQPGKNAGIPGVKLAGSPVKKILQVENPQAMSARLVAPERARVELNGTVLEDAKGGVREIPVSLLKKGDNEVVLRNGGEEAVHVKAASREHILRNAPERAGRPARSFTSADGGATWQPFDGEFMVRLHLVQHAAEGTLLSPVMDVGGEEETLLGGVLLHGVSVKADAEIPPGGSVGFEIRTGSTPVYEAGAWSDWESEWKGGGRRHRYVQWRATLKTSNPLTTPVLQNVTVEAKVVREKLPAWAAGVKVMSRNNPEIRYTSIPFAYEDPKHPKMVHLREKYKLDDLVAGAASEMEKFVRVRNWVSSQWKWTPPLENYPDWDADEILTRKYGFCVQHAVTYLQCMISLGYQTRFLFSNNPGHGGHEVCEVWSNEYQKWVYMDSADNFHYVDRETNVPLSMLETHDLIMKTYYTEQPFSYEHNSNEKLPVEGLGICYGLELKPTGTAPDWSKEKAVNGRYELSRMWTLVRYMPRNNFYGQKYPLPICQGRHWDYSDYIVWQSPLLPKGQWLYRNFTTRRSDLDWTINQARVSLEADKAAGVLEVRMSTVTPYFETYLAKLDGGEWRETGEEFAWRLRAGVNRVEVRVRNSSGVLGAVTSIEVRYDG